MGAEERTPAQERMFKGSVILMSMLSSLRLYNHCWHVVPVYHGDKRICFFCAGEYPDHEDNCTYERAIEWEEDVLANIKDVYWENANE